jgi:hypothetical protein
MTTFNFNLVQINGTSLTGVRSSGLDRRESQAVAATDGTLHQTSAPILRTAPRAGFSTLAVRALIGILTNGNVPYLALNGSTGWRGIALKIGTTPAYDAGTAHIARTMASGMVLLDGITWSPGQPAEAAVSVFGLSADGTTDPVASATIALPTLPTAQEQCVLTTLTVNGQAITRVQSLSISIGHQVENSADLCYLNGLPYPTQLQQPGVGGATEITCQIDTRDFAVAVANGTVVATFAVLNHNGVGTSASVATITLAATVARETQLDRETRRIEIRATWNGTTNPISVAAA